MVRSTSQHRTKWAMAISNPVLQHPQGKMTSQTPSSLAERRLAIARKLYSALWLRNNLIECSRFMMAKVEC